MRLIKATEGLDATGRLTPLSLTIEDDRITNISKTANTAEDVFILPALVNAHDHARPLRSSSVGGFGKPLEAWLHRLVFMAPVDPYLATLAPLACAALGGQGAVMIHHVRPIGLTDYVTEVIQMARAVRDVGVRVAFGVGMRDRNPVVYGTHDQVLACLERRRGLKSKRASYPGQWYPPRKNWRAWMPWQRRWAGQCSMCNMRLMVRNGVRMNFGRQLPKHLP
jgi:cytosine/adenosine deaminase-related metal-dependent hydrolase